MKQTQKIARWKLRTSRIFFWVASIVYLWGCGIVLITSISNGQNIFFELIATPFRLALIYFLAYIPIKLINKELSGYTE